MISQAQVISKILSTKDLSLVTLNNLSDAYFFNYKAEFNFIKNHYDRYKTVPDKITFLNTFPDFDYLDVSEPDSYLIEQLFKDYNTSYLASRFNEIKKKLETDNTDEAVEYFLKSVENLHTGAALTCTDLLTDTSRYDHYVERTTNWNKYYISTGFEELDKLTGGIDRENENMVIIARTGIGKSWTLLKMAAAASKQGLTVGIYSGEMSTDKVGYRIDTLLGHIKNSSITHGDLYVQSEYKAYIQALATSGYGAIKVVTPNDINGPATVNALRTFIEKEKLDILFVDQYSLLEDTSHARSEHEKIANISKAIKNLQVLARIPIISVSQQNRTKNEDGTVDTTMVFGSDRIGQDSTVLLAIERKDDQMIVNVIKARDGGDGKKLIYQADFNSGTFNYIPNEKDGITSAEEINNTLSSYEPDYSMEGNIF